MKKVNVLPGQKFLVINWLELHKGCELLASYIRRSDTSYDSILTANRGGLIVAGIVANMLCIRKIAHMGISILNDDNPLKTPSVVIHSQLNPATLTPKVLFVSDLLRTGNTVLYVCNHARLLNPSIQIDVSAIYYNKNSAIEPVYYVTQFQDEWLILPWDS